MRPPILIALSLIASTGCSNGGGGGGSNHSSGGFLEIETRVDDGGLADAKDPEIHADGARLYTVFVDLRNGIEELFLNRSMNGGQTWLAQDVMVPGASGGPFGVDPAGRKLAFIGDDVVAVFEEGDDMFANVSHDGGLTWKPVATRLDPGAVNANDSDDPVVLQAGGTFYAVWRDEFNGLADVYFASSPDLGETWTTAVQINTSAPGTAESDDLRMTVSAAGDLYVTWADDRNDLGGDEDVFFTRSTDGGATWLVADVQVNDGTGDIDAPRVGANGSTVYLAFRDDRTGDDGVYFQRSLDAGDTWAVMDTRLDTTTPGVPIEDVVLASDGDLVVVAWKVQEPGPQDDLYLNLSTDGGVTWLAAPMRLDEDTPGVGDSDDLQLAVMGQTIFAAWEDARTGFDDIYVRYSQDAGATWSSETFAEETALGSSDASSPAVALSTAGAWVSWHDDRNGNLDVFVNGGPLPTAP